MSYNFNLQDTIISQVKNFCHIAQGLWLRLFNAQKLAGGGDICLKNTEYLANSHSLRRRCRRDFGLPLITYYKIHRKVPASTKKFERWILYQDSTRAGPPFPSECICRCLEAFSRSCKTLTRRDGTSYLSTVTTCEDLKHILYLC